MTHKAAMTPIPVDSEDKQIYAVETHAAGPQGQLPLDANYLRTVSSGELFGLTEDAGIEETYQITSSLKHVSWGKEVALVTDARFSGVSTGACIGHVGPEALADGPIGRVRDGDLIQIVVDVVNLNGSVDLVGHDGRQYTPAEGVEVLSSRSTHLDLSPDPGMPDDTTLWAALQAVSGGIWGGCVYDVDSIVNALHTKSKNMGE